MIIPIKQALLEGYTLEAIAEAVHVNHPDFNKKTTLRSDRIRSNRNELKDRILEARKDSKFMKKLGDSRNSNFLDNKARAISQDPHNAFPVEQSREAQNFNKRPESQNYSTNTEAFQSKPRLISSAKQ